MAEAGDITYKSRQSGYAGRYFLVGFMQNEIDILPGGLRLILYIAAQQETNVMVSAPIGSAPMFYHIAKDSVITIRLNFQNIEMYESETQRRRAVEITAEQPVTVSGISSQTLTTDGFSALPVTSWGKEYVVQSWPNDIYMETQANKGDFPRSSEFMIIASENGTIVDFAPRVKTMRNIPPATMTRIVLDKGDCYLVKSDTSYGRGQGDLTGTIIRSDKPIGVYGGHVRTSIPLVLRELDSKNHLTEMLLPTSIWGTKYVTSPFINAGIGDFFRIVGIKPNTQIKVSSSAGSNNYTLNNAGDFQTLSFIRTPLLIESDQPISVVQYMSTSFGSDAGSQTFDPCMVVLPPIERFIQQATFSVLGGPRDSTFQFQRNFINLICDQEATAVIVLDGIPVLTKAPQIINQRIDGTMLNYVSIQVTPGVHTLSTTSGGFACTLYGTGIDDAYAYPLGMALIESKDTLAPEFTISADCGKLQGLVREVLRDGFSGLYQVQIIRDSTYNYQWSISLIDDKATEASFSAQPVDYLRDARIMLEASDKAGNRRILSFRYSALSLAFDTSIVMPPVSRGDTVCIPYTIRNTGTDTMHFMQVSMHGDERLRFSKPGLPLYNGYLAPRESIMFEICFVAEPDSALNSGILSIEASCGRIIRIPIRGTITSPALTISGHDFGKVRVPDSAVNGMIVIKSTGTSAVDLTGLSYSGPAAGIFTIDTAGIFPQRLRPMDSLRLRCAFYPADTLTYTAVISAVNAQSLPNSAILKGIGITPQLHPLSIDWKQRRTQTVNDSTTWIYNKGTDTAWVWLKKDNGDTAAFLFRHSSGQDTVAIAPGDSSLVNLSFTPPDTIAYRMIGSINYTNFARSGYYIATLFGRGTQPTVQLLDIDMGSVIINRTKDSSGLFIIAGGSENLAIDSIRFVDGDIDAFVTDQRVFSVKKLRNGDTVRLPVRFQPKRMGKHSVNVEMTSDAAPAYKRIISRSRIFGMAISADTIQAEINSSGQAEGRTCEDRIIDVRITNTGNKQITLTEVLGLPGNPSLVNLQRIPTPDMPQPLTPRGGTITIRFIAQFAQAGQDTIRFTARFSDTLVLKSQIAISALPNLLGFSHASAPASIFVPGDTVGIVIKGIYDAPSNNSVQARPIITVQFPPELLDIKTQSTLLKFSGKNGTISMPAIVRKNTFSTLTIEAQTEISLQGSGTWNTQLVFYSYLGDSTGTLKYSIQNPVNNCMITDTGAHDAQISGVCARDIRLVNGASSGFGLLGIGPHPVPGTGQISFLLPGENQYSIYLLDATGRQTWQFSGKGIPGLNQITISPTDLTSGYYSLIFQSLGKNFTLPFLFVKP
jgi:hypothetical protein